MTRDSARASPLTRGRHRSDRRQPAGLAGAEAYQALVALVRRVAAAAAPDEDDALDRPERIGRMSGLLARRIGLPELRCELVRLASPLHDVGRIALQDAVPTAARPMTTAERRAHEEHTTLGRRLLTGSGSPLLELAAEIAWTHHERYDGGGYPRGLVRDAIPLEGRIVAVADVFDALTSDRPFRPAFGLEQALRLMEEGRGSHFDPLLLDAFVESVAEFAAIRDSVRPAPLTPQREERRWRRRKSESHGHVAESLSDQVLETAVDEATAALAATRATRQAIDGALGRLTATTEPDLLASVYALEHDRLWCVAQRGYEQVRDGFPLDQGVMARALRTGEVQFVPDVAADPDFVAATHGLRSELALPLGDACGVLNLEARRPLPERAPFVFEPFADALGEHLPTIRDDIGFDLAGLARLFVYASSLRGTSAIAEFAARTFGRLLDLETAQLSLGGDEVGFTLASFWRRPDSALEPLAGVELERFARLIEPADTALAVVDLHATAIEHPAAGARRWLVWLPLTAGGDDIGVLVGCAPRQVGIDEEHVEAATLFAPHAAALLDVAQTLRREQRAAVTDSLTGLLNRRGFEHRFREEIQRAERAGRGLAVIIVDCDGLKAVNDRGGHELGDSVLLHVARCLRTRRRSSDIAARIGGDEFAMLMPEIEAHGAMAAAERLRRSLVDEVLEEGQLVTATFGIATFPADGRTPTDLLRAADRALYLAKERGRNRTLLYSATLETPG